MGSPPPHRSRKRFGQHFLQDRSIVDSIVAAISPQPGDSIVEIGPGRGALTLPLLDRCHSFQVIELDRDLIPILKRLSAGRGELTIHQADALKFDFTTLGSKQKPLRIVGNLPYNISTPLLFHLFEFADCITDMHFMLQREVVERMVSPPGNKRYGRLSVMAGYYCAMEGLFEVPPSAFTPAPKVDSAVVRLTPHPTPPVEVESLAILSRVVTQAFSQRRKTLRNSLKGMLNGDSLTALDIDPVRRPETLALEEFARIANTVARRGEPQ